jgi:phage tail-like protein
MAVLRDRPFTQFNFLVDIGTGDTSGPDAGFEEVSGLDSTVDVIEYRNGNSKENSVMKLTGLNKAAGWYGAQVPAAGAGEWFNEIRNGNQNTYRTVTISLQNEDPPRSMTWKLLRARIIKYSGGPLNARHRRRDGGDRARLRAVGLE